MPCPHGSGQFEFFIGVYGEDEFETVERFLVASLGSDKTVFCGELGLLSLLDFELGSFAGFCFRLGPLAELYPSIEVVFGVYDFICLLKNAVVSSDDSNDKFFSESVEFPSKFLSFKPNDFCNIFNPVGVVPSVSFE